MTFYIVKEPVIIVEDDDGQIHNNDNEAFKLMITLKMIKINLEHKSTQNTSVEFHKNIFAILVKLISQQK